MEKVIITKKQEELINEALKYTVSEKLVEEVANTRKEAHTSAAHLKNAMDLDTLIRALYIGYEVEQSKEDKIREVISSFCNGAIVSDWVIEDIKKIYEGVNDQ